MTELERILKNTLLTLEQELSATQEAQAKRLNGQQERLEAQARFIQELRQSINQLKVEQQESARHLQRLSDIHSSLEPLLSRLNNLLSGK